MNNKISKRLYHSHSLPVLVILFYIIILAGCAVKTAPPSELSTARSLSEKNEYKGALKYYQIAYNKISSEKEKARIREEIEKLRRLIIDDMLKEADRIYNSEEVKTVELLEQAIAALEQGENLDSKEITIKKELEKYKSEKETLIAYIQDQLKKARILYSDNRLREIDPLYEKILKVNPSNKLIRFNKANLKIEIETMERRYLRNAQEYSRAGYTESARLFLEKLIQLNPNHPAVAQIKKELATPAGKDVSLRLNDFERQKKWFTAYNILRHSKGLKGYDKAMDYIKKMGSKHYYERSIRDFVAGDYYSAYIAIDKARMLDQNDQGILRTAQLCEAKLEKELKKGIVINVSHSSLTVKKELTRGLTTSLVSRLPYGMRIKNYKAKGKSSSRVHKVTKTDTVVTIHYKKTSIPGKGHDYALIHIIDFDGTSLHYNLKQPSNSFVIPVSHSTSLSDVSLDTRATPYGYDEATRQIIQTVTKVLGEREKRFYQLAAMYEERDEEKREIKYLALGSYYCRQAKLNTEYCKQIRTLAFSVTE